ncbi:MAG TPA: hypothetical protein VFF15_07675 [Flavobacteriaceae bacterium]|nr:hypothetical protein [Flavobacteriaceae bacterium]
MENSGIQVLMNLVFEKAKKETKKTTAYALAQHLNTAVDDKISERSFIRYYDGYIRGKTKDKTSPDTFVLNTLAAYLGFESFTAFEEKHTETLQVSSLKKELTALKKKYTEVKYIAFTTATTFALIAAVALLKYTKKECMIWVDNRYEKIKCSGLEYEKRLNERALKEFRKVRVCKDSVFFKNGQPRLHYVRHNNTIDFFTAQGEHPLIKGKFTSPVTQTIINSRVKPCDSVHTN